MYCNILYEVYEVIYYMFNFYDLNILYGVFRNFADKRNIHKYETFACQKMALKSKSIFTKGSSKTSLRES